MGIDYLFTGDLCGFGAIFDDIVIIARLIKKNDILMRKPTRLSRLFSMLLFT